MRRTGSCTTCARWARSRDTRAQVTGRPPAGQGAGLAALSGHSLTPRVCVKEPVCQHVPGGPLMGPCPGEMTAWLPREKGKVREWIWTPVH